MFDIDELPSQAVLQENKFDMENSLHKFKSFFTKDNIIVTL